MQIVVWKTYDVRPRHIRRGRQHIQPLPRRVNRRIGDVKRPIDRALDSRNYGTRSVVAKQRLKRLLIIARQKHTVAVQHTIDEKSSSARWIPWSVDGGEPKNGPRHGTR